MAFSGMASRLVTTTIATLLATRSFYSVETKVPTSNKRYIILDLKSLGIIMGVQPGVINEALEPFV